MNELKENSRVPRDPCLKRMQKDMKEKCLASKLLKTVIFRILLSSFQTRVPGDQGVLAQFMYWTFSDKGPGGLGSSCSIHVLGRPFRSCRGIALHNTCYLLGIRQVGVAPLVLQVGRII